MEGVASGLVVGVDGVEGAGKTTLVRSLVGRHLHHNPLVTTPFGDPHDEHKGTNVGHALYELALDPAFESDELERQVVLALAARRHYRIALPRLRSKSALVLSDRSIVSTWAYAAGLAPHAQGVIAEIIGDFRTEDVVLVLDVEPDRAWARRRRKHPNVAGLDTMDVRGRLAHARVSEHFRRSPVTKNVPVLLLDANQPAEEVLARAVEVLQGLLGGPDSVRSTSH
jgi:thymidylate kinase